MRRNTKTETGESTFRGTIAYASPEQWKGEEVTKASDIYSFGRTLHFLLTGSDESSAVVTVIGVSDIACHGCMLQCGDGGIYYRTYLSHIHLADRVECDTLPCRFSRGLVTDSSDGSDWNMVSGTAGYED